MGLINNHGTLYTDLVIKHEWECYTQALPSILYRHTLHRPWHHSRRGILKS